MDVRTEHDALTRRDFVKLATAAAATAAAGSLVGAAEQTPASAPASRAAAALPARPLGRTGVKVTMLNMGSSLDLTQRLIDQVYAQGVRCFDTAGSYGNGKSEQAIGQWFTRTGNRKDIFLVTKTGSSTPRTLLRDLDKHLEALKTDYLDMYFLHGIGDNKAHTPELAKSQEFKEAAEALRKTGKVRFVGFSCHVPNAPAYLAAAAEGGFLDGIMMSYNAMSGKNRDEPLDRALDACHKAGIGLIAMKTMRGLTRSINMETLGDLTVHQAVIQAALSDERIATVCSEMKNFTQVEQNAQAVRTFKPMTRAQLEALRERLLAAGLAFCPGCPACRNGIGGTNAQAHDILRYLSYYEQDGQRERARRLYRALPAEARDVSGTDLAAAREACAFGVDYPALLARAREKLA